MILFLLAQIALAGSRLEARTPSIDLMLQKFRHDWSEAVRGTSPNAGVTLEFPEDELYLQGQRAIAMTTWNDVTEKFETTADWRALWSIDEATRKHVAIHEACHLKNGWALKKDGMTQGLRMMLEMEAEKCVMLYMAIKADSYTCKPCGLSLCCEN